MNITPEQELMRKMLVLRNAYMVQYGHSCRGYPSINKPNHSGERSKMTKIQDCAMKLDKMLWFKVINTKHHQLGPLEESCDWGSIKLNQAGFREYLNEIMEEENECN